MESCLVRESWIIEKRSKKAKSGVTTVDIAQLVKSYSFTEDGESSCALRLVVAAQNPGLNPSVLVNAFTEENPSLTPKFVRYFRMEALDGEGKIFR